MDCWDHRPRWRRAGHARGYGRLGSEAWPTRLPPGVGDGEEGFQGRSPLTVRIDLTTSTSEDPLLDHHVKLPLKYRWGGIPSRRRQCEC